MHTYEIIVRKKEPVGTLEMIRDTCQAKDRAEAQKIFEERHGHGFTVAGPNKVRENNQ
jgi:hypothetical protein